MENNTSYGQRLMKKLLSHFLKEEPKENYRPSWLGGLELDLYYEKERRAFEFNGNQHYCIGNDYCGTVKELAKQVRNDNRKRVITLAHGIKFNKIECHTLYHDYISNVVFQRMKDCIVDDGTKNELEKLLKSYRNKMIKQKRELQKNTGFYSKDFMLLRKLINAVEKDNDIIKLFIPVKDLYKNINV